jgi:hypothetical protein
MTKSGVGDWHPYATVVTMSSVNRILRIIGSMIKARSWCEQGKVMTEVYREISITTFSSQNSEADMAELRSLFKKAGWAAFIILLGMLVHNLNAGYLEPTYLGFVDKAKDYGDMAKIQNAIEACTLSELQLCSFKYSGFAHMINGLMFLYLAVVVQILFRRSSPLLGQLAFVSGLLAGLGFLATGVSDIPGTVYASLLRELNPAENDAILLATTMVRGVVNIIAITGLGLFAAFVGRAALKTGVFSKWGAWWGFTLLLPGIGGLISPIFGFSYLVFVLPWLIWLGLQFRKLAKG